MSVNHIENKDLVELLKSRNMNFTYPQRAEETLRTVSYYKIKEFAAPFNKIVDGKIDYQGEFFEKILSRYYQDKNLRISLLHAIEDIEVALQTQIAFVLGSVEGNGYTYLDFSKWCNKNEYCKHYLKLKQNNFRRDLFKALKRGKSEEFKQKIKAENNNLPPIWLAVDLLTFGQLVMILELMSTSNLIKISSQYNCSNDELISWLKTVNLLRNICAHNNNIIDIKLKTMPILKDEWKLFVLKTGDNMYSNRVSVPIVLIKYLLDKINPKYNYSEISSAMIKLIDGNEKNAKYYGFSSEKVIYSIFPKAKYRNRKRNYSNRRVK